MNAAVVHAFDAPPNYTTFAEPVAAEGERIVQVVAAALHPIVKSLANGTHYGSTGELPFIPGVDGVGRLPDGARVYFGISRSPFGSFSERALAADWMCMPLPDTIDDVTAAAIANPAMSSWVALSTRARFVAGENVLILGATGVAGQLAIQIAKRLGASRVIAVGRNPEALERLTGLGADVVLDYLWRAPAESVLAAISQKGLRHAASRIRFVQIGASAGNTISLAAATLRSSGLEMLGSGFGSASLDQIRQALTEFFQAAAKAPFHFTTRTARLRDVEELWNTAEEGARRVFQP